MKAMKSEYGDKRGERIFYASANKGTIKNVHEGLQRFCKKVIEQCQKK